MNFKRSLIIFVTFLMSINTWALGMPQWIKHLPKAGNSTYYYRVTKAEGQNYEDAYAKAFNKAILESQWKIGVRVSSDNQQSVDEILQSNLNLSTHQMSLPINKVCEYEQPSPNIDNGIVLYILWQVAHYGNIKVEFENYLDCE